MCILASFNLLKNRLIFKTWGNDRVSGSGRVSWDDPQSLLGFLSIWDLCQLFSMDSLYLTMGEGIYDFQKVILGLQSSLQLFHNFQNLHFYSTFLSVSCSVVSDSVTPQTVPHQGTSVHGILQTRVLEWVAMPFSKGSSQPRDRTQVSCMAGRFFTIWATGKSWRDGSSNLLPCRLSIFRSRVCVTQRQRKAPALISEPHCRGLLQALSYPFSVSVSLPPLPSSPLPLFLCLSVLSLPVLLANFWRLLYYVGLVSCLGMLVSFFVVWPFVVQYLVLVKKILKLWSYFSTLNLEVPI